MREVHPKVISKDELNLFNLFFDTWLTCNPLLVVSSLTEIAPALLSKKRLVK
jgi:hypothetical protein